jgi:hypothetical protein
MGELRWGIPKDLVLKLAKEFNVRKFIETGTYHGNTSLWASEYFDGVTTLEASQELHAIAEKNLATTPNVSLIFGSSKVLLTKAIAPAAGPALFWLDAHYSGGITFGSKDECPLVEELNQINESPIDHFILIDDARLFLSPPYLGHDTSQWPSIDIICSLLQSGKHKKYIAVFEDVIFAVPESAKTFLQKELQHLNTQKYLRSEKQRYEEAHKLKTMLTRIVEFPNRAFRWGVRALT